MRIAFVAHHPSLHTRRWAGFYARRGHDVHVLTCGGGDEPADGPYTVHELGALRFGRVGYGLRVPRARRLLRGLRPDVVHAHYLTSYGLLALASGVEPLVVTAHGSDVLLAPRSPVLRAVVRRVLQAAALVTVPSEQMRAAVLELAGPGIRVETFQYGVETARLASLAAELRPGPPGGRRVRIVGARPLFPLYRFDVLLDALARLSARGVDWECTLYDDGPERTALELRAVSLGLGGRLSFAGLRPPEEVEQALAGADLYASFAESDGASVALLEAMALGPVPVVSNIPANRAWLEDGRNGVLSPIEPGEAARALERALALDREAVAEENRAVVAERADRDRNLAAFELLLEQIVADAVEGVPSGTRDVHAGAGHSR